MKKSYFPEKGLWLKGNLHSHTTVSDGVYTPQEIAELYASHGYDFFSMTDHNVFVSHEEVPQSRMLLLTGVEHDIVYHEGKCTHIVGTGMPGKTETGYECRKYTKEERSDQQLIDMMLEDGQFVVIAHPVWSRMTPEELLKLKGFHGFEVWNHGIEKLAHGGHAEVYYDLLLQNGMRIFAMASDDTHETYDVFGGWICVKAAERSWAAIMDALFAGAFYASGGPEILDYGMDGDEVYVECSDCKEIHVISYPPRGKSYFAPEGEVLNGISFKRTGRESYIRVECIDNNGRAAWTQPIYFENSAH
ncbi:hypothetical protein GPL15_11315 [Clostridium sp. MCC353]|uniref:PHP domain-containing protein n=1 Tax=Clostridium sp. MCC353 TaxID=2592646 RepID=UPI001C00A353|nr:CehA/McbA family metallohydrolase [Clostridium sp. MCC353]MBT9777091.1 hypothetical protein [Clostridium sp. MCC353]